MDMKESHHKEIPFNKPHMFGQEIDYIKEAIYSGKISGNGIFTKRVHQYFEKKYGFGKSLLTHSGTAALEMAALLIGTQPNDEIIVPSYTFVSTANAFVLRGAHIVFADSNKQNPNIDANHIESLISAKTKAIVVVHYAGIACDMDTVCSIGQKHGIYVIEDCAQAIDSTHNNKWLGTLGQLAAFSFHETKNIISGEGGLLVVNDNTFFDRAEIIWEKGTNRAAFSRGEVSKYRWIDVGSSFLPSELTAAFLFAQIEHLADIQIRRKQLWGKYLSELSILKEQGKIELPFVPDYASINGHLFYILCRKAYQRGRLIDFLKTRHIMAVFHYLPLHKSPFYCDKHDGRVLPNCEDYANRLVRLPLFYDLTDGQIQLIIESVLDFFEKE